VDDELDRLALPAVIVEGPKAVGKTRTLERRSKTVHRLFRQVEVDLVCADEDRLLQGEKPVFIDEFQRYRGTIDVVRDAVDRDAGPRQFYLAGSAGERADTHSGAGRIVTVRMRPLAFSERKLEEPTVSLAELLGGARPPVRGETAVGLSDYVDEVLRSGFPAIRAYEGLDRTQALRGYVDRVVQRDIPDELGRAVRRPEALRRWLRAYAAATATTTSLEKIRDAAHGGDGRTANHQTTQAYRDALERLWVLDDLPAWLPTLNHLAPLLQTPKRYLADPALAAVLIGASRQSLLSGEDVEPPLPRDGSFLGSLFEALVVLSARVYAQAAGAVAAHFRDQHGRHEVDLILERPDGKVLAVEVKLSQSVGAGDVKHLTWLGREMGDKLVDAVVVCVSPYAYRRKDGVAVVPLALLGP
jgi:predicted AAA+ superfamily ATPase